MPKRSSMSSRSVRLLAVAASVLGLLLLAGSGLLLWMLHANTRAQRRLLEQEHLQDRALRSQLRLLVEADRRLTSTWRVLGQKLSQSIHARPERPLPETRRRGRRRRPRRRTARRPPHRPPHSRAPETSVPRRLEVLPED